MFRFSGNEGGFYLFMNRMSRVFKSNFEKSFVRGGSRLEWGTNKRKEAVSNRKRINEKEAFEWGNAKPALLKRINEKEAVSNGAAQDRRR
jgi:hypothetical protein